MTTPTNQTAIIDTTTPAVGPKHFTNLFTMFYRHGMNAQLSKGFYHEGSIESAVRRAQEHCRIMGYRYIFVRPMVVDLESEEAYKLKGGGDFTSAGY